MFSCFNNKFSSQLQSSNEIVESDEPGYEEVELQRHAGFNRGDPNYESLNYSVHVDVSSDPSDVDPPYARVETLAEECEKLSEGINNNVVDVPVYAQVMKPKRATNESTTSTSSSPETDPMEEQDFSVGSSKNTTIIRIADSNSAFHYFPDDDSLGIPEQV